MVNANMLRAAIAAAGYTQAKLADDLKMSPNTLTSKINGRTKFDIDEVSRICHILKINDDTQKVKIFLAS